MSLHLLEELGFEHAATWSLNQDLLSITYHNYRDNRSLLYAIVSNQIVKYVGITERTFSNRMYGYQMPGITQATNIRVNGEIRNYLIQGNPVEVYCLGAVEEMFYRGLRINLPAGLENPLINRIAEFHRQNGMPQLWNKRGNRQNVEVVNQEAVEEAIAEDMIYLQTTPEETQTIGVYSDVYVVLGSTYYEKRLFNLGTIPSELLGADGEEIIVDCIGHMPCQIVRWINRTHNPNRTVRLNLGNQYTEWVQGTYLLGERMAVRILNRNHIQLLSN